HAFRILGSYQPGEKLTLNILRQRKKQAITLTVPEAGKEIQMQRELRSNDGNRTKRIPLRVAPIL
ncbi:MAG TPA: hypothetical protein VK629_04055, partial [Steroidobacteraceae bacterium]|nr:hypothetical protein [Steroidobacteraceae bacterium]